MHAVQSLSGFSGLAFKILESDNTFIWQIRTFWDGTDFSVKSWFRYGSLGSYGFRIAVQVPWFCQLEPKALAFEPLLTGT